MMRAMKSMSILAVLAAGWTIGGCGLVPPAPQVNDLAKEKLNGTKTSPDGGIAVTFNQGAITDINSDGHSAQADQLLSQLQFDGTPFDLVYEGVTVTCSLRLTESLLDEQGNLSINYVADVQSIKDLPEDIQQQLPVSADLLAQFAVIQFSLEGTYDDATGDIQGDIQVTLGADFPFVGYQEFQSVDFPVELNG